MKRKRRRDLKFFVELWCDKGRTGEYTPSGLSVTTADYWCFTIADSGIAVWVPTARLREAVEAGQGRKVEETDGNCPTRGVLLDLRALLA